MDPVFLCLGAPLVPALLASLAPGAVRRAPTLVAGASAAILGAAALILLARIPTLAEPRLVLPWLPALDIDFALHLHAFGGWFATLVLALGACILLYTGSYFAGHPRLPFLIGALSWFTLAMLGVIAADNLYLLFLFWEATSLLSFLLVGFHDELESAREKASQALLVTMAGGAAMLAGLIGMHLHYGSATLSTLLTATDAAPPATWVVLLIALGAMTKSAQWPFHFWLPNAMAGPTPVSAFLHSATMVKAGVFLLATLAPLLAAHPLWTPLLATSGMLTIAAAVLRAAREDDLKAILASTTLAALGFLTLLAGIGTPAALLGFVIFLTAHALYKAPLFLAVGNLEKRYGTRRLSELGGIFRSSPVTGTALAISGFSLLGLAPMPGFLGKEYLLKATWAYSPLLAVAVALAAAGVLALGLQLALPLLFGPPTKRQPKPLPAGMPVATILPALGALALMLALPQSNHRFLGAAASALGAPADAAYKLWHGWTPALGLGLLALALAFVLWRVLRSPALAPLPTPFAPLFDSLYATLIESLRRAGRWCGGLLGEGPLPTQLAVMLGAIGIPVLIALKVHDWPLPESGRLGSPAGLLLAPVIAVAAIAAARARRPLPVLVALGFLGLLVAFLFLWFSAPDLALTQLLAETLLLFLLGGVLIRAYGHETRPIRGSVGRAIFAGLAGFAVTLLILKSMAQEWDHPISDYHLRHSKADAYGANVVNVILVDFRALDTLGEILVLAIAALGATAALGAARRLSPLPDDPPSPWLGLGGRVAAAVLLPLALWLFWRGHNEPGGGFIAALVIASAAGLQLLTGRLPRATPRLRRASRGLLLAGLSVALLAALAPLLVGRPFFAGLWWHSGDLHLGTPLLFDLGVLLTVLGFALAYLRHFQPNRL